MKTQSVTGIISDVLSEGVRKKKSLDVIQRYLKMKHRISISKTTLIARLTSRQINFA